jgi:hypothetical protein
MDLCMDLQDRRLGRHHGDEDARNVGGGKSDACSVIARTEAASHPAEQKKSAGDVRESWSMVHPSTRKWKCVPEYRDPD